MLLIIDRSRKNAKNIADMFYHLGILTHVATPEAAVREISNRHRAILFCDPTTLVAPDELIRTLRTYSCNAQVFALVANKAEFKKSYNHLYSIFDDVFYVNSTSANVCFSIIKSLQKSDRPLIGDYKLAGFDISIFNDGIPRYFDTELPFTKVEIMIFRYLIRSYPLPAKPNAILRFAFKQSKVPEASTVRTHISVMNKKFREIAGRNLIFSEPRVGYTILTPEMMVKKFSHLSEQSEI